MKLPLSWMREYAPVEVSVEPSEVAERLTAAGLEVESVEQAGHDISGVVVAEVLSIEELTEFKKPIRYCQVATEEGYQPGSEGNFGVVCGATNFTVGDRVPLAKPGAVLPGGFEIGERKTYGRVSQGMICSASELGIGDDHSGILVLPPDAPLGADFVRYAGLRDEVFDIAVTPDRGDCVSVRGVARELAIAFGVTFTDPADAGLPAHAGLRRTPGSAPTWAGCPGTSGRPVSPTRPRVTGSCCARCATSAPGRARRCGCGSGWRVRASGPSPSRWT